jgi:hypothetical protein
MLFGGLPGTLGMQGGSQPVLAKAHIKRVGVRIAPMAEMDV